MLTEAVEELEKKDELIVHWTMLKVVDSEMVCCISSLPRLQVL